VHQRQDQNDVALNNGFRILSAYPINPAKPSKGYGDTCLWMITEADSSVTTCLLPNEYWRHEPAPVQVSCFAKGTL
jgi:hypothetical protein